MITEDELITLIDGNIGALSVINELKPYPAFYICTTYLLHEYNLIGPDIWVLYKDVCDQDIIKFVKFMNEVESGKRNGARVKHILRNEARFDFPRLLEEDYAAS